MVLPLTRGLSALIDADVHAEVGRLELGGVPGTWIFRTGFYATAWIDGRKISLHRFVWAI